jgi:hypothetical protein
MSGFLTKKWEYNQWKSFYVFGGPTILAGSICALCFNLLYLAWVNIILVDIYLIVLLSRTARFSDLLDRENHTQEEKQKIKNYYDFFPSRRLGLFLFALFLFSIVCSFATVYLDAGIYFESPIMNWFDALYLSFGTLTTANFGDFIPVCNCSKLLTMAEVFNSILLLLVALSLLISRVATYSVPGE